MSERAERRLGIGLWLVLIAAWGVAVWYMWDAMTTVPDPQRLEESRMAEIPTPRLFFAATAMSGFELAIVLALLWPWKLDFYASRMAFTVLALVTWFIMTTPMDLTRMDWIHRRWLAFTTLAVVAGLLALGALRLWTRARHGPSAG